MEENVYNLKERMFDAKQITFRCSSVVLCPFDEHQDAKVTEKEYQKDDLRNEFDKDVDVSPKKAIKTRISFNIANQFYAISVTDDSRCQE